MVAPTCANTAKFINIIIYWVITTGNYNSILFISAWYDENAINEGFGNMAWETLSKESLDKVVYKVLCWDEAAGW